jgi:hypothetical protein
MSVGVMKDYKLKLRNLRASHTLVFPFTTRRQKKREKKGKGLKKNHGEFAEER